MKKNNRIYQIDLFRFIAAISVVLFHYLFRGWAADNLSDVSFNEIGHFFKYGYLGVDFFFIISGFVILLSIKKRSISKFIISRFSRLYPIYWICLILSFSVIVLIGEPRYNADFNQFFFNISMLQNYLGVKSIDGVYWTLFVEMKFYIFIVGTYLLLNKLIEFKIEYLVIFWLSLTLFYIPLHELSIFKILNYFLILQWSSYFIAGMIFFQIYKNGSSIKYLILLSISFAISLYYAFSNIGYIEIKYNTSFSPLIIGITIFIFYLVMFLVTTNEMKKINSPKLMQLGLLTYPLYLIHQNIGYIIFNNFGEHFNKYLLAFITILLMITISFVLSKFYEPIVSGFFKVQLEKLTTKYRRHSNIPNGNKYNKN
jgi:peptidoglycan/LPS O-acetylase OafA/YrhL